jgi:hypothetical protein
LSASFFTVSLILPGSVFGGQVNNDLRLANGGLPANTSANQVKEGQQWLQFSYHADPATWRPHADVTKGHNMLTFLEGVWGRLLEAN